MIAINLIPLLEKMLNDLAKFIRRAQLTAVRTLLTMMAKIIKGSSFFSKKIEAVYYRNFSRYVYSGRNAKLGSHM